MVDVVQVKQAARHTTLATVGTGLAAQIVKVSSGFTSRVSFLDASGSLCKVTNSTAPRINQLSKHHLLINCDQWQTTGSNTLAPSYVVIDPSV